MRGLHRKLGLVATTMILIGFSSAAALADIVTLSNQDVAAGDGRLDIPVDDYGFWGTGAGFPPLGDEFDPGPDPDDPASNPDREAPSFFNISFLHVLTLGGKVALSNHPDVVDNYNDFTAGLPQMSGGPADYFLTLVQPNSVDNLPDFTTSIYDVTPNDQQDAVIRINLTQRVATAPPGPRGEIGAFIDVTHAFTNLTDEPLDLILVRHVDMDMPWSEAGTGQAGAMDDRIGVDLNLCGGVACSEGEDGWPASYAQDGALTTAALVLSTRENMDLDSRTSRVWYYATKGWTDSTADGRSILDQPDGLPAGLTEDGPPCYEVPDCADSDVGDHPAGGLCPFFEFGSDFPYWERPGLPNCWRNQIPGLGYDRTGASPVGISGDASIGYQIDFTVPPGDTYEVTIRFTYGYRPTPPRFAAPTITAVLVNNRVDDDVTGEFLMQISNVNPGGGEAPDDINVLYLDVEAGTLQGEPAAAGGRAAEFTLLPDGWTAENCTGFDENGHALFRLTNESGQPLSFGGSSMKVRFKIRANDATEDENKFSGVTVPRLSVVLSIAQDQPDLSQDDREWSAACAADDYSYGPTSVNGLWSPASPSTAFLAVPSLSTWGKGMLLAMVAGFGVHLMLRSRRAVAA